MANKSSKYKKQETYKKIKQDLLDQLERNGTVGEYFIDLVEQYMDFWVTFRMCVDDIKSRGVWVTYNNGGSQTGTRRNDSVDMKNKTSAQMLKILSYLGIEPAPMDYGADSSDDEM